MLYQPFDHAVCLSRAMHHANKLVCLPAVVVVRDWYADLQVYYPLPPRGKGDVVRGELVFEIH